MKKIPQEEEWRWTSQGCWWVGAEPLQGTQTPSRVPKAGANLACWAESKEDFEGNGESEPSVEQRW